MRHPAHHARTGLACLVLFAATVSPLDLAAQEPAEAAVTGRNCRREPRAKLLLSETLIGLTQPLGVENQVSLSLCTPLVTNGGVLFDYSNLEVGFVDYTAPIYTLGGLFVSASPLSVLNLRVEALGAYVWPFPMDGSGYYPLAGYDAPFDGEALPAEDAGTAGGFDLNGSATLQVQLEITSKLSVAVVDTFSVEYWRIGSDSYYYNPRRDLAMARADWLVKNFALLMLEYAHTADLRFRLGFVDDYTYVPGSRYVANTPSVMVGMALDELLAGCDLQPLLMAGWITHHAFRRGLVLVGGVNLLYEALAL